MFTEKHEQIIEQIAAQLEDANDPETAWALRGFVDGTQGYPTDPQVARHGYAGEYQRGYETGAGEWGENPYHHGDPYGNPPQVPADATWAIARYSIGGEERTIEGPPDELYAQLDVLIGIYPSLKFHGAWETQDPRPGRNPSHQGYGYAPQAAPALPPPSNPCGAGGYGYPPQAVPVANPVKDDGKWHKLDGGGYQIRNPGPYGAFSNAIGYHPRKDPTAARYASQYELTTGQKVPAGTKWIVFSSPEGGSPPTITAHRTLDAAKRAGSGAISRHANPWQQAASGPLASSFSPPPDPFQGHQIGSGPIASSYSPPVDPFGRPGYISGTLQGATAIRALPGYPLYTGG